MVAKRFASFIISALCLTRNCKFEIWHNMCCVLSIGPCMMSSPVGMQVSDQGAFKPYSSPGSSPVVNNGWDSADSRQ